LQSLERISATNLGSTEYEAAEMICKYVPSAEMVRFSLSGTEAVQNALRLSRAYTKKNKFVRFFGHYHGNADNILGGKMGDLANPIPIEFEGDFYDTEGKAKGILQDQSFILPWNNLEVLENLLQNHHSEIACLIMEPICINGGGIVPLQGYLEGVRNLCDKFNVVLIFDEIITGFRIGLGGAQKMFNVTPDLTTLGKAMAGGAFPVSAIVGKKEIMKLYETRRVTHGGTFNGYPLGMVAVKATLEILSESDGNCYDKMNTKMETIFSRLLAAGQANEISLEMKGMPSCGIFHFKQNATYDSPQGRLLATYIFKLLGEAMTENGILLSNLNRFYGSICIDDCDIELFTNRIATVFETVRDFINKMAK